MKPWLARSRAWISLVILAPVIGAVVLSKPHVSINSWADFACEACGGMLFALGVFFRWWATLYIGGRKTNELTTDGPYSICRNPIYLGTFLLTLAVAVFLGSLTAVLGVLAVSIFYFQTTVSVEEDRLRERHGAAFDEYCARVPRIIPSLRSYRSPVAVELRMEGLQAEFVRTLRYVWLPIGCHLVTHLRSQAWWPDLNDWP